MKSLNIYVQLSIFNLFGHYGHDIRNTHTCRVYQGPVDDGKFKCPYAERR